LNETNVSDQVIDGTSAGNKLRFINHCEKRANCFARVTFVNGTHRIGLYAKIDLCPGQELLLDYGQSPLKEKERG
jgi:histone-lysine N-methyltransferase EZH2